MYKKSYIFSAVLISALLMVSSCNDLEVLPQNAVPSETAITDLNSANAALLGLYSDLQDPDLSFDGYISMNGLFSGELAFTGTFPTRAEFSRIDIFPSNTTLATVFSNIYEIINGANNVEKVVTEANDASLSPAIKNSIIAEARTIRAYCYWILENNWGDVPLVLEPTSGTGSELNVPNSPRAQVVQQIISDLQFAETNLAEQKNESGFFVSQMVAKSMLARVYLQEGNYANALAKADEIITSGLYGLAPTYLAVFEGDPSEQIWYLNFTSLDGNSNAFWFLPANFGGRREVAPSNFLVESFEPGDERLEVSINLGNPTRPFGVKYIDVGTGTDPVYLIRYAEILLIAAEAAAETGDFAKANTYYNQVRARAGLQPNTLNSGNYVDAILQERYVELAMEGPQRIWDLRRRGKAEEILGNVGYNAPQDNLYPFPQREIDRNPNLKQNTGY